MWTREKMLRLIELLHALPGLWDIKSTEYKNRKCKAQALRSLSAQVNEVEEKVEKKIKSLKTQYRREVNKKAEREKNGESYESKWFAYSYLTFLDDRKAPFPSRSALTAANDGSINNVYIANVMSNAHSEWAPEPNNETNVANPSTFSIIQLPVTSNKDNFVVPLQQNYTKPQNTNIEEAKETRECSHKVQETIEQKDGFSVYGENVASRLRNSGQGNRAIAIAKHRIDNILFKLEMGMYAEC